MARPGAIRAANVNGYMTMLRDAHERLERMEDMLNTQVQLERQKQARVEKEELAYVRASGKDSGFAVISSLELIGEYAKAKRISLSPPLPYTIGTQQIYYLYLGNFSAETFPDPRLFVESIITDSLGFYSDSFSNDLYIPEGHGLWIVNPVPQNITVNVSLQVERKRTDIRQLTQEEAYALAEGFDNYVFADEDDADIEHGPVEVEPSDEKQIDLERTEPIQDERPQPHFPGHMTNADALPMHGEEDLL